MGVREIVDVDVVPDAGPVRGRVVDAEDGPVVALAEGETVIVSVDRFDSYEAGDYRLNVTAGACD